MAQPIKKSAIVDKLVKAEQTALMKAIDAVNSFINVATTFPINVGLETAASPAVWNKVLELYKEAGWRITLPDRENNFREFNLE